MSVPVLVVTNAYPDFPGSYHGIFVKRTVESLAGRGWRSHVLVPRIFRASAKYENFLNHDVTRFPFPTAEKLLIEYERVPVFRIAAMLISGTLAARKTIRRNGCRLIHAHWAFPAGLIALAAARISGLPLLLTVHGSDWRLAAMRGGLARRAFLSVAGASRKIVSVSREIADGISEAGVDPERIVVSPVGVDLNIFQPGELSSRLRLPRETVVSTRNLTSLYRVGDLLEAAAAISGKYPELSVTIAGDGPLRNKLEHRIESLNLVGKVALRGRLGQYELAAVLASSRVYVSTSPAEGASVSLLEAMAAGCLPVVTDIPANREWVSHGCNGLLFPAGNSAALADCLEIAFGNDNLRDTSATEGPKLVSERGSFSGHIENLNRLYRELTEI